MKTPHETAQETARRCSHTSAIAACVQCIESAIKKAVEEQREHDAERVYRALFARKRNGRRLAMTTLIWPDPKAEILATIRKALKP